MKARPALRAFVVFSLWAVCSIASAAGPTRDWNKYPAVLQLSTNEDVFAIGDPHGDLDRLTGVLLAAGLIAAAPSAPDQVKWTGGKSVLVVTGDMIDKGSDLLGVIALLRKLQRDAASHGGQVIISMGNHEAEFLAEPTGKKTSGFAAEMKEAGIDPTDVANCNGDLGQFLCNLPIAARVNNWFFSHGGNTKNRTDSGTVCRHRSRLRQGWFCQYGANRSQLDFGGASQQERSARSALVLRWRSRHRSAKAACEIC